MFKYKIFPISYLLLTLRMIPWPLEHTRHIRLPGPYLCGCDRKIDEWPIFDDDNNQKSRDRSEKYEESSGESTKKIWMFVINFCLSFFDLPSSPCYSMTNHLQINMYYIKNLTRDVRHGFIYDWLKYRTWSSVKQKKDKFSLCKNI